MKTRGWLVVPDCVTLCASSKGRAYLHCRLMSSMWKLLGHSGISSAVRQTMRSNLCHLVEGCQKNKAAAACRGVL
eukprot:5854836-Amphidinium_carterae.1